MALNVTKVNGVDKLKVSADVLVYTFYPIAIVTVNTSTTVITTQLSNAGVPPSSTKFADLEDNYGTADAEAYVDYLANNGYLGADSGSGGGGGGITYVSTLADLPDPVGGVIDLLDNGVLYFFTTIVDCIGLTIRVGDNALSGVSQELAGIENAVIDIDTTCTVSSFRFDNISMTIDDINGAYDWQFVNFYDSNNINIINAANVIWETFGFINTYNLQITGNVSSFVLSPNCIFRSVTTQVCDFFTVRSTAVVSRRIRIEKSVFITDFATQNPINVEAGASIPVESFVMSTVGFIGAGSVIGINGDDDIANFRDCTGDGVINSTSIANMYIQNNQIATPIAVTGDKYKVVGTTLVSAIIQRFVHDAVNNTLEYTSSISRIFRIQAPYTVFAGNNNIVGAYIAVTRNGNIETPNTDVIPESEMYTTTNGSRPISGMAQCIVTLNQGDKIYFAVENESQTTDVRIEFLNLIVETANV